MLALCRAFWKLITFNAERVRKRCLAVVAALLRAPVPPAARLLASGAMRAMVLSRSPAVCEMAPESLSRAAEHREHCFSARHEAIQRE
jgi:hypothetical protein